jgi:hypothetical protein
MAKIKLVENIVGNTNPAYKFKPTYRQPVTPMATKVNTEIKRQNNVRGLAEVDLNLSEEEKSRKKKIFKLAKMEALVHGDEKLTSIFNKILEEDPSEKYGYHWNETVMNILFNDYVLNNPVYFQKYKNAVPVKKKRRDMSGINQLRSDDDQTTDYKMAAETTAPIKPVGEYPGQLGEINLLGGGRFDTSKWFVQPQNFQPTDLLVFDAKSRSLINIIDHRHLAQQIGQFKNMIGKGIEILDARGTSRANLQNAIARYRVPPQIASTLKQLLASKPQGDMSPSLNEEEVDETTGAVASGSFEKPLEEEQIQETTDSSSSGQYSQPAIWAKNKKNMRFAHKPAWSGGQIVGESYLTDPACFNNYLKTLEIDDFINEQYEMAESIFAEAPEQMDALDKKRFVRHLKNLMINTMKRAGLEPQEYQAHFQAVLDDLKREITTVDPTARFDDITTNQNQLPPRQENHLHNVDDKTDFITQNLGDLPTDEIDNLYRSIEKEEKIGENNDQQIIQQIKKDLSGQGGMQQRPMGANQQQKPMSVPRSDSNKQWNGNWNNEESIDEYDFEDNNLHFSDIKTRGSRSKVRVSDLVRFAQTNPSIDQIRAFASGVNMDINQLYELANHYLENNLGYTGGIDTPEQKALVDLIGVLDNSLQSQEPTGSAVGDIEESMIDNPEQSMSMAADTPMSMKNKSGDDGMGSGGLSMGGNVDNISTQMPSDLSVSTMDSDMPSDELSTTLREMNMNEERKSNSQLLVDKIKKENEKNSKAAQKNADGISNEKVYGFQETGNDIIKGAQYPADKDFYISDDTKLTSFEEIEKNALKAYNEKKGNTHDKQVKRINSKEENKQMTMNRGGGMQDLVYDNKPSEKFEDRMKADMGDDIYKARQDKMKMKAKAPMYNKETQPTGGESNNNKFTDKYNKEDMNETLSASYFDVFNKRKIVEFKFKDAKSIDAVTKDFVKLEMSGFGNQFNNKVNENAEIKTELDKYNFYIKNQEIFKTEKTTITESAQSDAYKKMMHLMKYNPTKYVKK